MKDNNQIYIVFIARNMFSIQNIQEMKYLLGILQNYIKYYQETIETIVAFSCLQAFNTGFNSLTNQSRSFTKQFNHMTSMQFVDIRCIIVIIYNLQNQINVVSAQFNQYNILHPGYSQTKSRKSEQYTERNEIF